MAERNRYKKDCYTKVMYMFMAATPVQPRIQKGVGGGGEVKESTVYIGASCLGTFYPL